MSQQLRIRISLTAIAFLLALSACQSPAAATQSPTSIAPTIDIPPVSPSPSLPPASLVNGGFETGDLTGWLTWLTGAGKWLVYSDGSTPPVPSLSDPSRPFRMPDPPEGLYAAVTDMKSDGQRTLYQDVQLDAPYVLEFVVFYNNGAGFFNSSNEFRADLMSTTGPLTSTSPDHILATIFQTSTGDPLTLEPTLISFDLSPWTGQWVRIRFMETDNNGPLRAGVDNIRLVAAPP